MLSSIYEDREKGLGQCFDAELKELVYKFLGVKKENLVKSKRKV